MNKVIATMLGTALVAGLGSCSDDESNDATSGRAVSQTVTINDFLSSEPVDGVNLCWSLNGGEDTCVSTNADGKATGSVDYVAGDLLVLNATKDNFFPFRVEYYLDEDTPETAEVTWAIIGDALVDIVVAALGAEADPAKGHITVLITDGTQAIEGATAEMTTGTAA